MELLKKSPQCLCRLVIYLHPKVTRELFLTLERFQILVLWVVCPGRPILLISQAELPLFHHFLLDCLTLALPVHDFHVCLAFVLVRDCEMCSRFRALRVGRACFPSSSCVIYCVYPHAKLYHALQSTVYTLGSIHVYSIRFVLTIQVMFRSTLHNVLTVQRTCQSLSRRY